MDRVQKPNNHLWDSSVSLAMVYGLDGHGIGVDSQQGTESFLFSSLQTGSEVHSSLPTLGVKQLRDEFDHSTPSSGEVKNFSIHLHGVVLIS
jgi:hypothetical protein